MRQGWLLTGATSIGIQLAYPVFAHSGELHGKPEPETNVPGDKAAEENALDLETQELDAATPSVAEPLVSESVVANIGPTVGFSEALLGLIIVLPWLLMVLRKQLHPQPRP